jgi:hypothetical protein
MICGYPDWYLILSLIGVAAILVVLVWMTLREKP